MPAANIIEITDPDDPRVLPYRDVRERDLAGRENAFMAEGAVVLRLLLASRLYRARSLLIADKRIATAGELLAQVPGEVPVYAAGQAVLDAIAGFHLHRGLLAIGERLPAPDADTMLRALPERAVIVVLSAIANHDNMGGIFRNAAAFGADAVLLDADCCDPLYRKAIRVSVGAALTVPFARLERETDVMDLLARHGFEAIALSPSGGVELHRVTRAPRVAAFFGAEGPGLSAALMARAKTVRIGMADGFDSLNVATTSGIVLHHLTRGQS